MRILAILLFPVIALSAEKRLLLEDQTLEEKIAELESTVSALESKLPQSGSVYIRWGKKTCPSGAELVYTGYMAGNKYNSYGSGSDVQCLPSDPTWGRYTDGNYDGYRARIYGTEIDLPGSENFFTGESVYQQDMPCAVCNIERAISLMIPARTNCYSGWHQEYRGYLVAGECCSYSSKNHVCLDLHPDFLEHGGSNDNQNVMYLVEAQCGSLPCPPYHHGRELSCVVCSK